MQHQSRESATPSPRTGHALVACPGGPLTVPASGPRSDPAVRLSVVIPTWNERQNIAELVRQLSDALAPELGTEYELIVVDDNSADRTWEAAASLTGQYPHLRVVRRQGERGLSSAVIRGWQVARGDVLAVIDGDLQHPPEVMARLWNAMDPTIDLVVASRNVAGGGVSDWSIDRRMLSRGAQLLGQICLPGVVGRVADPMSGYFMVRRNAIANTPLSPRGYKILIEVLARGDCRNIGEVGYVFRERSRGSSKVTWQIYLQYLQHLWALRRAGLASRSPDSRRLPVART
jgi:dolichol-phosphate mannosyltransferase